MASSLQGESSVCGVNVLRALFEQKQNSTFCDVVMKVCGKEIYAHSNVLSAASPYFKGFLGLDVPRQFSQRAPQIIEIQIDGSESNVYYEEAVTLVVDFIYTGVLSLTNDNCSQVLEIAKIMQLDNVVSYCERYLRGSFVNGILIHDKLHFEKSVNTCTTDTPHPLLSNKAKLIGHRMRQKKLKSVAVQAIPTVDSHKEMKDVSTSTERWFSSRLDFVGQARKRGRPPKPKRNDNHSNVALDSDAVSEAIRPEKDQIDQNELADSLTTTTEEIIVNPESGIMEKAEVEELHCINHPEDLNDVRYNEGIKNNVSNRDFHMNSPNGKLHGQNENIKETLSCEGTFLSIGKLTRSGRKRKLPKKYEDTDLDPELNAKMLKTVAALKVEPVDSDAEAMNEIELNQSNLIEVVSESMQDNDLNNLENSEHENVNQIEVSKDEHNYEEEESVLNNDDVNSPTENELYQGKSLNEEFDMYDLKPLNKGKYSCSQCDFVTNKVREMSNHHKLHKFEQNTCYYCDLRFEDRDELSSHMEKHKGPHPFFCPTCHRRFKSRTMLSVHLPKHSDDKPYVCEICSASFKWKHALKGHMVTHSDKKEHLCAVCGYSTAHKSQLKAHSLIHTGELFKCEYPRCGYQSTKKQNLKYHYLTHTREKPHQCEVCGQAFSLAKNMRRHLLLHGKEKNFKCAECEFSSTRYDKLKEHRLKQHGFGTPPEKKIRTTDMLFQNIIVPSMIKKESLENVVDSNISESSEIVVDTETNNAAVLLQAIDEPNDAAEIEGQMQNINMENVTVLPNQVQSFQLQLPKDNLKNENVVKIETQQHGAGESMRIIRMTTEQLAKFSQIPLSLLQGSNVVAQTSVSSLSNTKEIQYVSGTSELPHEQDMVTMSQDDKLLETNFSTEANGDKPTLNENINNTNVTYIADDESISYSINDGTYIAADGSEFITTSDATSSGLLQEYITSDGHVVHVDANSVLTAGDSTIVLRESNSGVDGVEYAEIMVSSENNL